MTAAAPAIPDPGWRRRCGLAGWRLPVMVLGFIVWWPIGPASPALFIRRPAMFCCNGTSTSQWKERMRERMRDRAQARGGATTTGNAAFDEYRAKVLTRLDEERRQLDAQAAEFAEFVRQLRRARDQEEFERFMEARARKN